MKNLYSERRNLKILLMREVWACVCSSKFFLKWSGTEIQGAASDKIRKCYILLRPLAHVGVTSVLKLFQDATRILFRLNDELRLWGGHPFHPASMWSVGLKSRWVFLCTRKVFKCELQTIFFPIKPNNLNRAIYCLPKLLSTAVRWCYSTVWRISSTISWV